MKYIAQYVSYFCLFISCLFLFSCSTVPISGRSQFNLIPDSTINSMSEKEYREVLKKSHLSKNTTNVQMIRSVGRDIQKAVEKYFAKQDDTDALKGYEWEFNLIEEKTMNAWCMPGGKVAFYTGILPVAEDKNGVAVIMGHEVAHAIAKHGSERMSQALSVQMGGMALSAAMASKPEQTKGLLLQAFGAGAQVGLILPFSRTHESEADRMGLVFMAIAGYDPRGAVKFWTRFSKVDKGEKPSEFMSTHPSDEKRIADIQAHLPEALSYYKR